MPTTLLELHATRINGERQKNAQVVYLNPEYVIHGASITSGTNITYQVDKGITREYDVTEAVGDIATASSGLLLNVQLTRFMGDKFKTPKSVLLNTGLISSVSAAANPATGQLTYAAIAYSREGKLNEQFIAAQDAATLAAAAAPPAQVGSGTDITVDSSLSTVSTNPVQNKAVAEKIASLNTSDIPEHISRQYFTFERVLATTTSSTFWQYLGLATSDAGIKIKDWLQVLTAKHQTNDTTLKEQVITTSTLTQAGASPNNKNIDPAIYTSNATVNRIWTDSTLKFTEAMTVSKLILNVTASATIKVYRATISGNALGAGTVITVLETINLPVTSGTTQYTVNIAMGANEFLCFNTPVSGAVKYKSSMAGITLASYSGTGATSDNPVANSQLGVGYEVTVSGQTEENTKRIALDAYINNLITASQAVGPLRTKRYDAFGDSITLGYGLAGSLDSYAKVIGTRNSMTFTNRAYSGARMAYYATPAEISGGTQNNNYNISIIKKVKDALAANPTLEYVTIFGGTNDMSASVPIEDDGVVTADMTTVFGSTTYNLATFKGAIKWIIKAVTDYNPNVKLAFITPLNHKAAAITYRNAILAQCAEFGVPVIDLYSIAGIAPLNSIGNSFMAKLADGTTVDVQHPAQTGHNKLANTVETQLELL